MLPPAREVDVSYYLLGTGLCSTSSNCFVLFLTVITKNNKGDRNEIGGR